MTKKKTLKGSRALLGITGSVAAYKAVELARRLKEEGVAVSVVMTGAARNFIAPLSFESATGNKVYSDLFSEPMAHIRLPEEADIMVVAPATANIIGKFSCGIADDLLSTCLVSFRGKTVIAPTMNWRMYENPIVQKNLGYLKSIGVLEVAPERGSLACGEEGVGRMASSGDIIEAMKSAIAEKDLLDERLIVTAGPTREYIDPVRFISNRSTGRMGYAIARVALRRGAEVTLISGPSALEPPAGARFISVETAGEMRASVIQELPAATAVIMAAAISDFSPANRSATKLDKSSVASLTLRRTPDILSEIGAMKNRPVLLGFAAETGKNLERARKKLLAKGADIIVFNDVTAPDSGFEADTNRVVIIEKDTMTEYPLQSKDEVADVVLDRVVKFSR